MEGSMADAVIANRGLNFATPYGAGYGGNFHGDGSAINANVNANRDLGIVNGINENSRDLLLANQIDRGHTAITDNINTSNQFLSDRIWSQGIDSKFAQVTAQFASAERLAYANAANVQREMNTNQIATMAQLHAMDLKQTECCCKLEAGQAAILAKIESDKAEAATNEVNNLRLQLNIVNQGRNGQAG